MKFLSAEKKPVLQHISVAGIALTFVLLYVGAVSLENPALAVAGLVSGGVTAVIAWLAF